MIQEPAIAQPKRPRDPQAAKAYVVLERYCASCHQAGRTRDLLAAGNLSNILALDELARNRATVHPGLPDASRLYDILLTRHAPLDVYRLAPAAGEPSPDNIETVRNWLKDIPASAQTCRDRQPITRYQVEEAMREALLAAGDRAHDLRFLTLHNLYNACAGADEMTAYRQALIKFVNSVSTASTVATLRSIGPQQSILVMKLSDFGWTAETWERVQRAYPATLPQSTSFDIRSEARTPLPIVNGDWFVSEMGRANAYYALLSVPTTLEAFAAAEGVDIARDVASGIARRAAIRASRVTRANRLAERHAGRNGAFWLIYDFASNDGAQNVFETPSGPKPTAIAPVPFRPEQIRVVYALANGLVGFALFDGDGRRLESVLPGIDRPPRGRATAEIDAVREAGVDCFACHVVGMKSINDELRAAAAASGRSNYAAMRVVLPMHASESEMALLLSGDTDPYRKALAAVGVDVGLRLRGEEIVTALAGRYRRSLDLAMAAADANLAPDDFLVQLALAGPDAKPLARRLQHGVLPRRDLDRLFRLMHGNAEADSGFLSGGFLRAVQTDIGLSLWLDKARPRNGDAVTIQAEADHDCYLTVIGIDDKGVGTVLYPNEFDTKNRVQAGQSVSIPSAESPYLLRYDSNKPETVLARCSVRPDPPLGIEHNYDVLKFTVLGNWENYVREALETEAEMRRDPLKAARARRARQEAAERQIRAGRRRGARGRSRATTETGEAQATEALRSGENQLRDGRAVLVIGGD